MFIKKTNVLVCRLKGRIIGDGAVKDKRYEKHMIKLMFNCQKDLQLTLIMGRNNIRKTFIYIILIPITTLFSLYNSFTSCPSHHVIKININLVFFSNFTCIFQRMWMPTIICCKKIKNRHFFHLYRCLFINYMFSCRTITCT